MPTTRTLEEVIERYGDWAEDAVGYALDLIRGKQALLRTEVARWRERDANTALLDYLEAYANSDPTDPEVAQYFLIRKRWGWAEFYSEPHGDRIPRPRGRPAKTDDTRRKHTGVYLSDAERAAVEAVLQPGESFSEAMQEAARLLVLQRRMSQ